MQPTWTGTCRALGATRAGVCGGFQKVGCQLDSSQTRRACLPHTRPGQVTVPQAPRGPCTQVAAVHLGQWACSSPRRGALSSRNPRPFTKRRSWSAALKATLFQSPRAATKLLLPTETFSILQARSRNRQPHSQKGRVEPEAAGVSAHETHRHVRPTGHRLQKCPPLGLALSGLLVHLPSHAHL